MRDRLEALISRNVYYQLVEWGEEGTQDGRAVLGVRSGGMYFPIGFL